jgi:hypothetical protein
VEANGTKWKQGRWPGLLPWKQGRETAPESVAEKSFVSTPFGNKQTRSSENIV